LKKYPYVNLATCHMLESMFYIQFVPIQLETKFTFSINVIMMLLLKFKIY